MIDRTKIPHGDYCYDDRGVCPFWSHRRRFKGNNLGKHECGYCKFLGKGDYELNKECKYSITYPTTHVNYGVPMTAEEIGMPMSLLWDQVKMCNENMWSDWKMTLDIMVYGI